MEGKLDMRAQNGKMEIRSSNTTRLCHLLGDMRQPVNLSEPWWPGVLFFLSCPVLKL